VNSKQAKDEIKKMFPNGIKFDKGKQDWTLLPWDEVTDIVKVLDYGAKKYDRDNWQRVPDAVHRYEAAFFRHMVAFMHGEKNDKESGLPHLAHAGCCLLFLAWFDKNKKNKKAVK
jgi:hypothetical protein